MPTPGPVSILLQAFNMIQGTLVSIVNHHTTSICVQTQVQEQRGSFSVYRTWRYLTAAHADQRPAAVEGGAVVREFHLRAASC